ncbi:MAG: hypothetical protein H6Q90_5276 [Deltaproteobacteria bacterium]|nr:hypothetical protein [Deltaproteobacteria bacterium]
MPWPRILRALLVAYVAMTAVHIGWVMAHEPFSFDAWNLAVDTESKPFTVGRFFDYWWFEYTHSNPRLGQAATYLAYKLDWFAEIATPLAYLAMTLAVTVLGLGRWPRRGRELALWAIAIGFGWFVFPELGRNMFCRAYGANYIYGAAVQLWLLAALRLVGTYDASTRRAVAFAVAGLLAGACNEHTGPALAAFLVGYAWWLRRRHAPSKLVWASALGFAAGFAMLFFAPGQAERYDGLATKVSLPMRMIQRGVTGNVDILRDYVIYAAPLLVLLVIVMIVAQLREPMDPGADARRDARHRALRLVTLAIVLGVTLTATLFVSPKLGSRFYLVPMALLLAASIAVLDAVLVRPRQLAPLVILAVAASSYAAARTVPLFAAVAQQGAERMAALDATRPGDVFVADAFDQVEESWWFIGDDFRDAKKRELVASYLGLSRVVFRGYDTRLPLGMSGIRVVPRYWVRGEPGALEDYAFDPGGTRGFDIAGIQAAMRTELPLLGKQLAPRQLERFELAVEFVGNQPALPRPKLVVARWDRDRFEGYTGAIVRTGRAITRTVRIDQPGKPFDIYILQPGSAPRRLGTTAGEPLRYEPWRTGIYWALACDATECWVFAAARNNG